MSQFAAPQEYRRPVTRRVAPSRWIARVLYALRDIAHCTTGGDLRDARGRYIVKGPDRGEAVRP